MKKIASYNNLLLPNKVSRASVPLTHFKALNNAVETDALNGYSYRLIRA